MRRDEAGTAAWRDARRETGVDDRRTSGVHEFFTILSVSSSDLIILLVPIGSFPRAAKSGTWAAHAHVPLTVYSHLSAWHVLSMFLFHAFCFQRDSNSSPFKRCVEKGIS